MMLHARGIAGLVNCNGQSLLAWRAACGIQNKERVDSGLSEYIYIRNKPETIILREIQDYKAVTGKILVSQPGEKIGKVLQNH